MNEDGHNWIASDYAMIENSGYPSYSSPSFPFDRTDMCMLLISGGGGYKNTSRMVGTSADTFDLSEWILRTPVLFHHLRTEGSPSLAAGVSGTQHTAFKVNFSREIYTGN